MAVATAVAIAGMTIGAAPAPANVTGTVTVAAGETLKIRSGPSTTSAQVGALARGATISIICKTSGTAVNGITQWDKLANGYVSHAYVSATASIPSCAVPPPPAGNATVDVAAGAKLNVRSKPSSTATLVGTLADGARITIICKTTGTSVNGTTRWDKISTGYISHAYVVSTATVPNCPNPAPPPASPPPPPPSSTSTRVNATVAAAKSMVGRYPYSYAAGNFYGATAGLGADSGIVGFDCSGLMEYAFYKGAGIKLASISRDQYAQGSRSGWLVPLSQRRAGDMFFSAKNTSDPSTIHHVGLLTSASSIVHAASHDTDIVADSSWAPTAGKTMPYVVRPIR